MTVQTQEFTPAEAAALVGLSEQEVRKEIEYKIINGDAASTHAGNGRSSSRHSSPRLSFAALVYLYLVRRSPLLLRSKERSSIYQRIVQTMAQDEIPAEIEVVDPFYLRLDVGVALLAEKVSRFLKWKASLSAHPDMMGGAVTFPNSRLTVRHVGGMVEQGVDAQEILEDYPYLDSSDLEFAHLFVRAYPDRDDTMDTR
ncbi:MAG: DUF433 domain-containing protein [Caldilineaceae bacterium]